MADQTYLYSQAMQLSSLGELSKVLHVDSTMAETARVPYECPSYPNAGSERP
jgi:hypothetical protein